ncbi:MAG TPA: hypothetical protein VJ719_06575 [Chthoniobacterales bacterium]|nr:hypothetical protein [Chthoniobacterales bacterium]
MRTSIACLLLAFALVVPALAETLKIPADKPVASITFPEGWKATVNGETITASNEDGDVLIDVITTRPDMLGPSNDKAFALLKVKPDFDSFKDTKSTLNGMNVVTVTVDAKGEGGAMKLTLTSVETTKEKGVMVILRGEGVADNEEDITAIMNSIAAVK